MAKGLKFHKINVHKSTNALNKFTPGKLLAGEKPCVDLKPTWHCLMKQVQGKCQRHPKWAARKCKKSCSLCENTKKDSKSKYVHISNSLFLLHILFCSDTIIK